MPNPFKKKPKDNAFENPDGQANKKTADKSSSEDLISKQQPENLIPKTWRRIMVIVSFGVILVIIISFSCPNTNECLNFFSTFGSGMLIGGASFAAGGLGGFIFGIPSLTQNTDSQKATSLKYNDNLIQISDWLTKIIVGVGLVQLTKIPDKIRLLGESLKSSFGNDDWGRNASLSIVFYFFLFGFLIIYFWTRTDFTNIIYDDVKLREAEAGKEKAEKKAEEEKKKFENVADAAIAEKNKERIQDSAVASDAFAIELLKKDSSDVLKTALDELKKKVNEVLKNKPVTVNDDLQKGRWGGKTENNGKQIRATVVPLNNSSFFNVLITVSDTSKPLEVPVAIFVHDSFRFPDNVLYVNPNANGVAQVTLIAYEAFTIGALFADGTELELDLNDQPGYPENFYWDKNSQSSSA